ncbi:DUF4179 domain-containing protein [Paenibacillus glycanilyticus]|uniref:DUF4179 domain-containing protein n=1 Tax=Paenibacillus glycanilyticus TaxID=126569 RepID=A0ABQ6GIH3_9BACL|nr:DUF4179 domain-containing protein [Paenibacillus glycanilyticus]GLX70618.1 hypothetical protein MU1_49640 [Paenibacillus glycanilyticus]
MSTIDEKLRMHKQNLNQIKAPEELEDRLRQALHRIPERKGKKNKNKILTWSLSAAAALILLVSTYQYPAFAYYGSKLLNQMELSSLNFAEVAEQGYGQTVNKSKTFEDGTTITVNGVIADDNQFLMYYTIDLPGDETFKVGEFIDYDVLQLKGFLTDSRMVTGSGGLSDDHTQFLGVNKFEKVSPLSRKLTAYFSQRLENGTLEKYPITFKFNANKAMKSMVKEKLDLSVPVDEGAVHYDTITASPTATVIRGHYELDNNDGFPMFPGKTKLLVNGKEVESFGYRAQRIGDRSFEINYDVLPTDQIESIEVVLENFAGYQKMTEPISLAAPSDRSIKVGSEKLWVRSVTKTTNGYDIVIARKQFTILDKQNLAVQAGGKSVPVHSISMSCPWDLGNGNILWEQTYSVQTTDKPEALLLSGFHYIKTYNKSFTIPVGNK